MKETLSDKDDLFLIFAEKAEVAQIKLEKMTDKALLKAQISYRLGQKNSQTLAYDALILRLQLTDIIRLKLSSLNEERQTRWGGLESSKNPEDLFIKLQSLLKTT